jgi:hypothetical protein
MTPAEYLAALEHCSKIYAAKCDNSWRQYLAGYGYNSHDGCQCETKLECVERVECARRCRRFCKTSTKSIHSSLGDYESHIAVYLAANLHIPWYTLTNDTGYHKLYPYDIYEKAYTTHMTEAEAYAGLVYVESQQPDIKTWLHYGTLYAAVLLRWPTVIALLTDWMERRQSYFTPAGVFARYAKTHESNYDTWYGKIRTDTPKNARAGPHNIPDYLAYRDRTESTINLNKSVEYWIRDIAPISPDFIASIGRTLACNVIKWEGEECESFHRSCYNRVLRIVAHYRNGDSNGSSNGNKWNTMTYNNGDTVDGDEVIWHTKRTRCTHCVAVTDVVEVPELTEYEKVLTYAVDLRRRRLRGVFFCAMRLLGKVRAMHYRPGIGMYYKEALADFNKPA